MSHPRLALAYLCLSDCLFLPRCVAVLRRTVDARILGHSLTSMSLCYYEISSINQLPSNSCLVIVS